MHCFNHPEVEAVGICKVCDKGLCKKCAVEKDGIIYCEPHSKLKAEEAGEVEKEAEEVAKPVKKIVPKAKQKPLPPKVLLPIRPSTTLTPALVGGVLTGLVVGIPFVNLLCPVWLLFCGLSAGYILVLKASSEYKQRGYIRTLDGAMAGAFAGFIAANAGLVLNLFISVNLWAHIVRVFAAVGVDLSTANLATQIVAFDPNLDLLFLIAKYLAAVIGFMAIAAIGGALAAKLTR